METNQKTLFDAIRERDEAIAQIATNTSDTFKDCARSAVINVGRMRERFTSDDVLQHAPSSFINSDTQIEVSELQTEIQRAMDKLPEKARLVFILKRHEGLSLNEIADQLGISPKTVENQITRALKILKDELEPYLKNMNSV